MPNGPKRIIRPGRHIGGASHLNKPVRPEDPLGAAIFDGIQLKANKTIHSSASGKFLRMPKYGDMNSIVAVAALKKVSPELLTKIVERSFSVEEVFRALGAVQMPS